MDQRLPPDALWPAAVGLSRRAASWPAEPPPDAIVLELDPGLAFGTGTHATTALCLEWLDGHRPRRPRLTGCSTTAAAPGSSRSRRCSSAPVGRRPSTSIPRRLVATRDNALRKGGLRGGSRSWPRPRTCPGTLRPRARQHPRGSAVRARAAARAPGPAGGRVLLAGLLARQAAEVAEAYRPWFDIGPATEREDWTLLVGRRRAE